MGPGLSGAVNQRKFPAQPCCAQNQTKQSRTGEEIKPRVVAGGKKQVYQGDYEKRYAHVVDFSIEPLDLIFGLGWHTRHVDVQPAFLNGCTDHRILYAILQLALFKWT